MSAKRQETLEQRCTQSESSHQPPDAAGSVCHRAKDAGGSCHDESGRAHGRSVHAPLARDGRQGEGRPRRGASRQRPTRALVRSAFDLPAGATRGDSKRAQRNLLGRNPASVSKPRRTWSAESNSPRMDKSGLEHRGLSRVAGKGRRRTSDRQTTPEARPPNEPMNTAPETLQSVFDRAFAGISQARESFAPQLTPREVGTITTCSTGIARVSGLPGAGFEELLDVSRRRVRHRVQRGRGRNRRRAARRLLASARWR